MKWLKDFLNDLGGSLAGGGFYAGALSYPLGRCWRYLLLFLLIISLVMTFYFMKVGSEFFDKGILLFESGNYKVVFDKGIITNLPAELKIIQFEKDTMAVWDGAKDQPIADSLHRINPGVSLFVGPKGVFTFGAGTPQAIAYPPGYTASVDAEYLKSLKSGYYWIVFLVLLIIMFLIFIPWSAIAIIIFIIPILTIKFSRLGMKFGMMWKLGMFLVTFHFIYMTITMLSGADIPYGWVINFPIYILAVIFLVKIEKRDLEGPVQTG